MFGVYLTFRCFSISGTFGQVEHVLLVGTAGAVKSSLKSRDRIKLGDVIATSGSDSSPAYVYVHNSSTGSEADDSVRTQKWSPKGKTLRKALSQLERKTKDKHQFEMDWRKTQEQIKEQLDTSDTSRATESAISNHVPSVHFGGVGAGKHLAKNESTKRDLRAKFNVLGVDCGFQAVMESLEGNRKEDFALVRVACDWQDGLESRNLHSDAALRAATFTKLLISLLPRPRADSDDEE